ncbi:MAG: L-threonylcarbamoyladenylate synthase [Actinomycetota bacterium]|nr:threonylcarbamoyl-AMP synthase [Actinomycetota bacterium]MDQ3086007.1 L-threonylcarbamoyladenylate synthase [Actinomycetota bacterium]MDQ3425764.1 L-threonylcarbamoyladenylate synthase [Actinomycetota bacterium]
MSEVERAIAAIRAAEIVVIPTDTVYGLACDPNAEESVRALSLLKGRSPDQPIAIVASSVDSLIECVPDLPERALALARHLLPGPYTLVLPNPARRFPWLSGRNPETIGVRVPDVRGPGGDLLEAVRAVAATSANLHGGPEPRRVSDVPDELREAVAVVVEGGELPGTPSTVLDLTGSEPRVLREGAVLAAQALAEVRSLAE